MAFSLQKLFPGGTSVAVSKPQATVGIDVGSASVKVVELEQTERALMLRTYGELQLGPYGEKDLGATVTLPTKQKTEAVIDVLRESQVSVKHGALAMPLSSSFLTVMPVNFAEGEDPGSRITVEAKKYVPLPLTDVTLDWTELDPIGDSKTTMREILLAAIENRALADYKGLLNIIGMTGEPAEVEAFSLVRALWKQSDTSVAIIDIGAQTAKLYIARNGTLERIHRVVAGGELITKRASELLGISFVDAENLKRTYTKDMPEARDLYKATVSVTEDALREFARLIGQYEARIGSPIGRIVCTGGVSASPFFLSYTADMLAHENVVLANPFSKIAYPAFMEDTLRDIAPIFGASLGAALRQFQYDE